MKSKAIVFVFITLFSTQSMLATEGIDNITAKSDHENDCNSRSRAQCAGVGARVVENSQKSFQREENNQAKYDQESISYFPGSPCGAAGSNRFWLRVSQSDFRSFTPPIFP